MKTTVEIPDALFNEAKKLANREGRTFKSLLESSLRQQVEVRRRKPAKRFKLRKLSFHGRGLQDGINEGDWSEIRRRSYEGRGG